MYFVNKYNDEYDWFGIVTGPFKNKVQAFSSMLKLSQEEIETDLGVTSEEAEKMLKEALDAGLEETNSNVSCTGESCEIRYSSSGDLRTVFNIQKWTV